MVRLKTYRLRAQLTQENLARGLRAVEPRLTPNDISRYETGLCLPTLPQLRALETALSASRLDLYDREDLDLMVPEVLFPVPKREPKHETRRGVRTMRRCFRMSRSFAETLPADLLEACGYTSWQSWYDAAIKRLLGEYAARKKAASRGANTADGRDKNDTHTIHHPGGKVNGPHAER